LTKDSLLALQNWKKAHGEAHSVMAFSGTLAMQGKQLTRTPARPAIAAAARLRVGRACILRRTQHAPVRQQRRTRVSRSFETSVSLVIV
jgi:hypothetical protein